MAIKLILVCGIPGSGKSTWIKTQMGDNDAWVSRDAIRFAMLKDGEDYFSREGDVFKEFVRQINEALAATEGYVYADATHLSYSSRMKVLSRIANRETIVDTMVFDIPLDIALERNAKRTGRAFVPEDVIRHMYKDFSFPEKGEGIRKAFYIDEDGYVKKVETLGGSLK